MNDSITVQNLKQMLNDSTYSDYVGYIEALSRDSDWFVRTEIAALLGDYQNEHAEGILLSLLHDKSYLVQVEAIDSLSSFPSDRVRNSVLHCMNSIHPLVRGYAYRCICSICPIKELASTTEVLKSIKEKNTWARIMLLVSQLQLGDNSSLRKLEKAYKRCNYLNRIAILNGLADSFYLLSQKEKEEIRAFANAISPASNGVAVQEAIVRLKETADDAGLSN